MANSGLLTRENFWKHSFTISLNTRGRIALCFVIFTQQDNQIILEDMALFCGFSTGECEDWLDHFMQLGYLKPEMRWS